MSPAVLLVALIMSAQTGDLTAIRPVKAYDTEGECIAAVKVQPRKPVGGQVIVFDCAQPPKAAIEAHKPTGDGLRPI